MNAPWPTDQRAQQRQQLEQLYAEMAPLGLTPLWEVLHSLVTSKPSSAVVAHSWSYDDIRAFLMQAGDLISAEQAERRVLILENPGLRGRSAITSSLYAGLQMILPGEVAPCHRHSQCALRFVLEGSGAYTAVDGEKAVMKPFDLVLTPGWQWHDHGNETDHPMIWLDGLDIPTVTHFDASFSERLPSSRHEETAAPGASLDAYGHNMRPFRGSVADRRPSHQPLFHYPYSDWRASLGAMASSATIDPHLGHALEFINPATGGPMMPTIGAHVRLLPVGFETAVRQSTDATVYVVVEGTGTVRIDDYEIALKPRDLVVSPSWSEVQFQASSELVLFGFSDKPVQECLQLYREHRV
jgi:gentisate 1,2-dioxygenase